MKCIVHVLIEHPGWDSPFRKRLPFEADTFDGILDQIRSNNVPEHHVNNLKNYRRTQFKGVNDVVYTWELKEQK